MTLTGGSIFYIKRVNFSLRNTSGDRSSIVAQPMNGLRRNDAAMKTDAGIKNIFQYAHA